MWRWLRTNWSNRQSGAISDLVWATTEIVPDWTQIQISRNPGSTDLVLSVTGATSTTVRTLSRA